MQNPQTERANYICFQWTRVLISFDIYIAVELVGHCVSISLALGAIEKMFSKAVVLIYTLSVVVSISSNSLNSMLSVKKKKKVVILVCRNILHGFDFNFPEVL